MMELRTCSICKEEKNISEFLTTKNREYFQCKQCTSKRYKEEYQKWLEQTCGGERILSIPNRYQNDIQRNCVFQIMISLGYLYNESKGIWWKKGVKDEDGNFLLLKKNKRKPNDITKISKKVRKDVIKYHLAGFSNVRIEQILHISNASIHKIIKSYLDEKGL